jgi:hypothetical protein
MELAPYVSSGLYTFLMAPMFFENLCTPVPRYFPQHTILGYPSLYYFRNMKDQVSYPFKTAENVIYLFKINFYIFAEQSGKQTSWSEE